MPLVLGSINSLKPKGFVVHSSRRVLKHHPIIEAIFGIFLVVFFWQIKFVEVLLRQICLLVCKVPLCNRETFRPLSSFLDATTNSFLIEDRTSYLSHVTLWPLAGISLRKNWLELMIEKALYYLKFYKGIAVSCVEFISFEVASETLTNYTFIRIISVRALYFSFIPCLVLFNVRIFIMLQYRNQICAASLFHRRVERSEVGINFFWDLWLDPLLSRLQTHCGFIRHPTLCVYVLALKL